MHSSVPELELPGHTITKHTILAETCESAVGLAKIMNEMFLKNALILKGCCSRRPHQTKRLFSAAETHYSPYDRDLSDVYLAVKYFLHMKVEDATFTRSTSRKNLSAKRNVNMILPPSLQCLSIKWRVMIQGAN